MSLIQVIKCSQKNKFACIFFTLNYLLSTLSFTVKGPDKAFLPNSLSTITRSEFILSTITATSTLLINIKESNAFDGGVGGLGKTKPNTGVVFRDKSLSAPLVDSDGVVTSEIISPDGSTPILVSFKAPWPILKTAGLESRDLSNPESAFVQVSECPKGIVSADFLPSSFFKQSIFSQSGKYGMYGEPTDIKIKEYSSSDESTSLPSIRLVYFSTLTPAMRESDRTVFIAAKIIENSVYMLVTGTTAPRFKSKERIFINVAESFRAIAAPKSSLRSPV